MEREYLDKFAPACWGHDEASSSAFAKNYARVVYEALRAAWTSP
jgi:hypothetical protein